MPATVAVSLDKPTYRTGETMRLTVRYTVPDDSVATIRTAVQLPDIPVTDDLVRVVLRRLTVADGARAWAPVADDGATAVFTAPASKRTPATTATARLAVLGATVHAGAGYAIGPALPTGWSPGSRPGESEPDTVRRLLATYPDTAAIRLFFGPGKGLPASAWQTGVLAVVPSEVDVVVSWKDPNVDAAAFVAAWLASKHSGRLVLIPHHEPEQGDAGDPSREAFRQSWTRLRAQVGAHPARAAGRLQLAVCYTLQWVRRVDNAGARVNDWRRWWPDHEAAAVDLVLGDWYPYDPTAPSPFRPTSYEAPDKALAVMLELAKATGKRWGIGEINHERITKANGYAVDHDPDGSRCAAWYRQMHAYATGHGCQMWTHFHRGGGDLTTRSPELAALRELIAQD